MSGTLDAVGAVPGVLGAFLARDRTLTASSLPLIFSTDTLGDACAPLQDALRGVAEAGCTADGLSIRFGDARVVGAPLYSGELLLVVCQANMDANALKQLQEVLRTLRTKSDAPATSESGGSTGSGGAGSGITGSGLTGSGITGSGITGSGITVSGLVLPLPPTSAATGRASTSSSEGRASLPGLHVRGTRPDESSERQGSSATPSHMGGPSSLSSGMDSTSVGVGTTVRSTGRSIRSGPLISPESRSRLALELARFVGPVAQLLVDEHLQSAQQLAQGIERLSREIESLDDREEFLSRVSSLST